MLGIELLGACTAYDDLEPRFDRRVRIEDPDGLAIEGIEHTTVRAPRPSTGRAFSGKCIMPAAI